MDLHVEKQCIDQMKEGNLKQFLLLFDAYFEGLYKYVARRVGIREEVERIVRLSMLDAIDKVQETPSDSGYLVWLYSLAKPKVWSFINQNSFPDKQGLISVDESKVAMDGDALQKVEKMLGKLSLEEREILKLKFFEEVADGDVITVLGEEEGTIGPKIYRVLKRAHFLLFGESDEKQGVYFGELSGMLEKVRRAEKIEIPESFKLGLRADLNMKIERRDFAIEGEGSSEELYEKTQTASTPEQNPWAKESHKGSDDPAKIFVNAVKDIKDSGENVEDYYPKYEDEYAEYEEEKREQVMEFFEKWKFMLALIPALLFVLIVGFVAFKLVDFSEDRKIVRGYPSTCRVEVEFGEEFYDSLKRMLNRAISDRICNHFEGVERVAYSYIDSENVKLEVNFADLFLNYDFAKKDQDWRIQRYAKTFNSDQESGKVPRD